LRVVQGVTMPLTAGRILAAVFALSWFVVPGFGIIDLTVTWNASWPQMLEAGWGLFSAVIVGLAFVVLGARPWAALPAAVQLLVATVALAVSGVVSEESGLLWFAAALALQTAVVARLCHPSVRDDGRRRPRPRVARPMLLLAAVGVAPWSAYALHMWQQNREGEPGDVSVGIDHYSMQGALALVLALLPLLAALRPDMSPFVPTCAGIAAAYLGLVSFAWQGSPGAFATAWSAAAIVWGLALVAAASLRGLDTLWLSPKRQT
jgi:hypothetical protein